MFGLLEKLLSRAGEYLYRRGQAITQTADKAAEERRTAVRAVREALAQAMTDAELDREHGKDLERDNAILHANRANSLVHEIADAEARSLVVDWKAKFDAIPKGWKHLGYSDSFGEARLPSGYPEPAWSDLRQAADAALDRLGTVLRELLQPRR